jgi:hypothetical protein
VANCRTCADPQVATVNALIASGTPIRALARMTGIPRSSLARHAEHVPPADRPLGLIPLRLADHGRVDPLAAALELVERAGTERELMKAQEQVRAATALLLRQMGGEPDEEQLRQLDANLAAAEDVYRAGPASFEHAIRALQGVREAIRQRIDAAGPADPIEVSIILQSPDGADVHAAWLSGEPARYLEAPEVFWAKVPKRFRSAERFECRRRIQLTLPAQTAVPDIVNVYERSTGALMWTSETHRDRVPE